MASVIGLSRTSANNLILSILPEATTLSSNDLFVIEDGTTGELKKITKANLKSALGITSLSSTTVNQVTTQYDLINANYFCPTGVDQPMTQLSVTIKPNSVNSIMTLNLSVCGEWNNLDSPHNTMIWFKRYVSDGGVTNLRNNDPAAAGSCAGIQPFQINYHQNAATTLETCNIHYVDDLSGAGLTQNSTVTYTPFITLKGISATFYLNRVLVNPISGGREVGISTLQVTDNVATLAFSS
jgi:hypothetical protein